MKAYEFLALGLRPGDRVTVTLTDGTSTTTTYDGLRAFATSNGHIKDPDTQLKPLFRAPTLHIGGPMDNDLADIASVERLRRERRPRIVVPDRSVEQKIQTLLIGAEYPGDLAVEKIIGAAAGAEARLYDKGIDDGADDDNTEDQYVMKACFEVPEKSLTVRVYYGDVTEEIGYVEAVKN